MRFGLYCFMLVEGCVAFVSSLCWLRFLAGMRMAGMRSDRKRTYNEKACRVDRVNWGVGAASSPPFPRAGML